jgi:hypothetical protein
MGEEELLAQEGIEEGARKTGISEKNVNPKVATNAWPNKNTQLTKGTRTHYT